MNDKAGSTTRQEPQPKKWFSREEACELLMINPRTLQRRVNKGEIERRQIGREASYLILTSPTPEKPAPPAKATQPNSASPLRDTSLRQTGRFKVPDHLRSATPGALSEVIEALTGDLVDARTQLALIEEKRDNAVSIGIRLSSQMGSLSEEVQGIEEERDALKDKLQRAEEDLEEAREERDELESQLEDLYEKLGTLKAERDAARRDHRALFDALASLQTGLEQIANSFLSFPIRKKLAILVMATTRSLSSPND